MEGVSFKPSLCKKSAQIIQRRNERMYAENVSDNTNHHPKDPTQRVNELYQEAFLRNQKLERLRLQPADEECTFQPKLMKGSRTNRNELDKSLLASTQQSIGGFGNGPIKEVLDESRLTDSGGLSNNVFERLTIDAKILPEKRKGREQAELERQKIDPKTGQVLFKPRTGRSIEGREQQVRSEGGVANYLYNKHQLKDQAQKVQRKRWEKAEQDEI